MNKREAVDEALLAVLACGSTIQQEARQVKVSERTIRRRLADVEFSQKLQALVGDMVVRTSRVMTAASLESVKTLMNLQKEPHPSAVRLGAARAMLEIGMKVRDAADVEQRLAALEQQVTITNCG